MADLSNTGNGVVVGVDLGGTKTAAAVVAPDGTTGPVHSLPTPAKAGADAILDTVVELVVRSLDGQGTLTAVGIGTAGVVDASTGTIVSATDAITGWAGTRVADGVAARLHAKLGLRAEPNLQVVVENDVDAHGAGEAWLGAAAGARVALMVAVGTGVGGSVLLDGRPLRGAHHLAGEMGHMPTPGVDGLMCGCGRPGHLEALGSGPALHRYFLTIGGTPDAADTRAVVALANAGDPLARQAVTASASAVGRAVAAICTVLDPEVVVIGGGMAGAGELWWSAFDAAVRAEVIPPLADVRIVPAALGTTAAIVGAARRCLLTAA